MRLHLDTLVLEEALLLELRLLEVLTVIDLRPTLTGVGILTGLDTLTAAPTTDMVEHTSPLVAQCLHGSDSPSLVSSLSS